MILLLTLLSTRHKSNHEKLLQNWTKFITEHQQLLHAKTALTAEKAVSSTQITTLKGEVSTLETREKRLDDQNFMLKISIAKAIARLDLIGANYRVFTCVHDSFDRLPDRKKSTRELPASSVAYDLFETWGSDKEFKTEYQRERQYILDHHLAHERADPGRGEWAVYLKGRFLDLDYKRNIQCHYAGFTN